MAWRTTVDYEESALGAKRRMTAILGISAFYHDSAAALVVDGRIVAAAQEERFTRNKHDPAFPARGDRLLPARGGPGRRTTCDYVAFYDKPLTKFERLLETYLAYAPRGVPQLPAGHAALAQGQAAHAADDPPRAGRPDPRRLVFTDHHESHAASAFFPCPFEAGRDPDPRRRRRMEHDDLRRRRGATGSA